ncbi:protein beta [Vibrio sp. 03-59-1]|uniref:beta family protein n=1 Tax=Vibrio sp. 03-59-1 TaxID=2607607 RepID=UPI001493440B|nr:protein beta [Vibrio sp. 03-59-1]NOH84667.1 protein beta [Vibrio sp. 03-59-1]
MFNNKFQYCYCPILAISPSEITALKELPDKDKDLILPVFPLKSWTTAKEISSPINKIEEAIGKNRKWIVDLDYDDLLNRESSKFRPVHHDILKLTDPANGYQNWCNFIKEHPNTIPCLQLKNLNELSTQLKVLSSFQRGVVVILKQVDIESQAYQVILPKLKETDNLLVILDLEQITKEHVELKNQILMYLQAIKLILPQALISLSSTSFPDGFGGYHKGVKSIYERALFDKLRGSFDNLVYSDRGSARATKMSGGAGVPPPRIDYSCRNEWNFIRMEFSDTSPSLEKNEKQAALKKEKKELYTLISKKIMAEPYWEENLGLWANYIIELTSKGDDFGINSAQKATAVRINKHLHTQLHYDSLDEFGDTDDDWED